jgi:glutathione S-transferase
MLKLYHCPETRSMRVLWLLHELGVPFELIEMPFELSATRSAAYLAVHPLGRVPCLMDHGFNLFESGAITEYLCERFPESGLGRLQGDPERYEWLQWIHYSETIAVHAAALVQQYHFIAAEQRSAAVLRLEGRRLHKAIELVNSHLEDRDYLLGSGFSAADISVGYSLHLAHRFIAIARYPHVESYYERLRARSAFGAALPKNWQRPLMWLVGDFEPVTGQRG